MKFKLDENFGNRTAEIIKSAGYDVETVYKEGLTGESDSIIFEQCKIENRCLITLDMDFADILRFPTNDTAGIIVVRPLHPISLIDLENIISDFLIAIQENNPQHNLWILQKEKIRIRKGIQ